MAYPDEERGNPRTLGKKTQGSDSFGLIPTKKTHQGLAGKSSHLPKRPPKGAPLFSDKLYRVL
jgi:hypothetical protein